MINKNNNGGSNGGFDEEAFDEFETEFSDADLDDAGLDDSEFADLPEDGEYEGDDFEAGEWEDEPQPAGKKAKKEKSLYQTGEKKGLGFNTIVIICGVVLGGGVLAFNIMNKSAEVAAGQKGIFQSVLNIGGVMDGMLFGDKEPEPTPEEQAAQNVKTDEGFLSNPDMTLPENANANPDQPLTPMPEGMDVTPRGPEEAAPAQENVSAITPADTMPPIIETPMETAPETVTSAEDILKQAMANRQQKTEEKPPVEDTSKAEEKEPVAAPIFAAPEPPTVSQAVTQPPVDPLIAAEAAQAAHKAEQSTKAVAGLETKIDTLLKRMEQMEKDLGAVKTAATATAAAPATAVNTKELESQIAALKKEITAIKDRPLPVAVREKPVERPASNEPDMAVSSPKPVVKKKQAARKPAVQNDYATAPKPKAAPAATGRWELRAAQPGRAWVSKLGERDMQGIEVGQSLPGVGRITAITYQNGRWTVTGTQGRIQQ